ncbi:MAG: hypothetical protein QXQ02_03680 [Halobacteria archaeon]
MLTEEMVQKIVDGSYINEPSLFIDYLHCRKVVTPEELALLLPDKLIQMGFRFISTPRGWVWSKGNRRYIFPYLPLESCPPEWAYAMGILDAYRDGKEDLSEALNRLLELIRS